MIAIELKGLTKTYDSFQLGPCDLTLPAGTILGLVGENGAGKSTTLRLLLDLARPTAGEISILGQSIPAAYPQLKNEIGVVLDEACLPLNLNAKHVGSIMASAYRNWDAARYRALLDRFQFPEKKVFKDLSRGMRMKLAIAAALSHRARLLVLDEATSGLDPIVREEVLDLLRECAREEECTVLISSHIVSDLEKLCDTIAFLHQGSLLFHEAKDDLRDRHGLFVGTEEQYESLRPEAVVGYERSGYGGIRALVRRDLVPDALELERPTVEDVILYTVRGAKLADASGEAPARFGEEAS